MQRHLIWTSSETTDHQSFPPSADKFAQCCQSYSRLPQELIARGDGLLGYEASRSVAVWSVLRVRLNRPELEGLSMRPPAFLSRPKMRVEPAGCTSQQPLVFLTGNFSRQ